MHESNEDIIKYLKKLAIRLGRSPMAKEVRYINKIIYRFGSFGKALKAAGLEPAPKHISNEMTEEELIEEFRKDYKRICIKYGRNIGYREYSKNRNKRLPAIDSIKRRFGLRWNDLLKRINANILKERNYNKAELIEFLVDLSKILGRTPTTYDIETNNMARITFINHFGSFNNALKEAGLPINRDIPKTVNESDDELIKKYIIFSKKINKADGADTDDLKNSDEIYNPGIFILRFGGIQELKIKCGFNPQKKKRCKYNKEMIMELLLNEYKKNRGERLTYKQIVNNKQLPCVITILTHFKTTKLMDVLDEVELLI